MQAAFDFTQQEAELVSHAVPQRKPVMSLKDFIKETKVVHESYSTAALLVPKYSGSAARAIIFDSNGSNVSAWPTGLKEQRTETDTEIKKLVWQKLVGGLYD